ncbi:hypothetical protein BVX94_03265 [bacterium B17]|nr:hypothetical protein BVX94_03265 [bacterium B17]
MRGKSRYIIGLGNYARDDDSIGLRVVEQIVERGLDKDFTAVEVGNNGITLLTYFNDETERILVVDCACMGKTPGDYLIFSPDDVASKKTVGNISTHEGDILKLIELGKQLGDPIPEIKLLAIEPESLGMDMKLSDTLASRLDEYVDAAVCEIESGPDESKGNI